MENVRTNILEVLQTLAGTSEQVFVYATLLNPKLRKKLLKREPETFIDKLAGFREITVSTSEGDRHTLIQDKNMVMGRRFFVTPKELRMLDRYEEEYIRKKLKLKSGNIAWVYFLKVSDMKNEGRDLKS
jgi:gamma-glutamylcyclotransferase (GGCT)/AIG2-like uncharacterized protein YtfP